MAPYSGAMLATHGALARRQRRTRRGRRTRRTCRPRPACAAARSRSAPYRCRARPRASAPVSRTPTTSGRRSTAACRTCTPSASSPPTPQPSTPMPLIIGVWLSVPSSVSGTTQRSPSRVSNATTVARCSRLIVCMMPVPGGSTRMPLSAARRPFHEAVALGVAPDLVASMLRDRASGGRNGRRRPNGRSRRRPAGPG